MKVGKLIFSNLPKYNTSIQNMISADLNKIKIELNNCELANNIINEAILNENKLNGYIPLYFVGRAPTNFDTGPV